MRVWALTLVASARAGPPCPRSARQAVCAMRCAAFARRKPPGLEQQDLAVAAPRLAEKRQRHTRRLARSRRRHEHRRSPGPERGGQIIENGINGKCELSGSSSGRPSTTARVWTEKQRRNAQKTRPKLRRGNVARFIRGEARSAHSLHRCTSDLVHRESGVPPELDSGPLVLERSAECNAAGGEVGDLVHERDRDPRQRRPTPASRPRSSQARLPSAHSCRLGFMALCATPASISRCVVGRCLISSLLNFADRGPDHRQLHRLRHRHSRQQLPDQAFRVPRSSSLNKSGRACSRVHGDAAWPHPDGGNDQLGVNLPRPLAGIVQADLPAHVLRRALLHAPWLVFRPIA